MKYNPHLHHRQSIRLQGYDYSSPGAYFITIVTWQRQELFGDIIAGKMRLNDLGAIASTHWERLSARYNAIITHQSVVMPNHVHGVVEIQDCDHRPALGAIVRTYKTGVTIATNARQALRACPVWQRNYYEHIIRTPQEWEKINLYIESNPSHWIEDSLHPNATPNPFNR